MPIGNRVTEKDIREWLDDHGFSGQFAQLTDVELHAIERPGWVQVFRFHAKVRAIETGDLDQKASERPWLDRWGVVLDDERKKRSKTQVWIFDSEEARQRQLDEVSAGKLVLRSGTTNVGLGGLLVVLAGIFLFVVLISWMFPI